MSAEPALDTPPAGDPAAGLRLARIDLRHGDAAARAAFERLARRGAVPDRAVRDAARRIVDDVREHGEEAVRRANARFGGGLPDGRLALEPAELAAARDGLPAATRIALERAIASVRAVAADARPVPSSTRVAPGVVVERRWLPVERAGCYVPGGTAPYPSSLVMTVVPARVAGVGSVAVASPADARGHVDPVLAGAAGLLGVDRFVVAGGAQAVAALAFGLPSVGLAPADVIAGPGNAYVTAAKLEVMGEAGIDLLAGPSEGCVLADARADPVLVAADLLTQAEHGPDSPAILVTPDAALADAVEAEAARQLAALPRREILRTALERHGRIVLAADLDAAIEAVNAYAPEHLSIEVAPDRLETAVEAIRSAGSVFVGAWAPESAGDYATGANHVLPTGGLARAYGPLAVETFGRFSQVQRIEPEGLATLRPTIVALASAEGLDAHRRAAEIRFETQPALAGEELERRTDAVPGPLTPVTFVSPAAPASYAWEATSEAVATRYGLAPENVLRFDLNTSPEPPALAARVLAAGRFDVPVSEYPPSDYRRLAEQAATAYGCSPEELLVGAGADEILDLCAKAFLRPGDVAIVPAPTYAMYRVVSEQRGARPVGVPRLPAAQGFALDVPAMRAAARSARLVWLCDPNNPTGMPEPRGTIERLLDGLAADAASDGRRPPTVVIDEAYAEFRGRSWLDRPTGYPRLVLVRTMSKAYALAGMRVGFAVAPPELIAELAPYRPPGSVAVPSVAVATAALAEPAAMRANVARLAAERERLVDGLAAAGWRVAPSVTNFVLVDFGGADAAARVADGLLARGLVPRTFGAGHPLAGALRLTVRSATENERLVAAAHELSGSRR